MSGHALRLNRDVSLSRVRVGAVVLAIAAGVAALWVLALPHNPPCCYDDEASTAYNAWLIAQHGRDEYGAHLPLYFQAFGEFRSPVQIYLMAGLFKLFGAHLLLGRFLTRACVFLAVLVVAWLGYRISGRRWVAVAVAALGLTTPQLYEMSRLGTEAPVVLLPMALFLLAAHHASRRASWSPWMGVALALPLAVAAYTYPIARPLAVVFAVLLALFWRRSRLPGLVTAWVLLAALLVPVFVFMQRHPGALSHYAGDLTWTDDVSGPGDAVATFIRHFAGNVGPGPVLFTGDPNPRHHVGPWGAALIPMALLALGGLVLVLARRRREPFWLLVAIGFVLALLPATFTRDAFHEPRLIMVPLFALVLCVPALLWLAERGRGALVAVGVATAVQAAFFFAAFVDDGTSSARKATFEHDFARVFRAAEATGQRPIWALDKAYIDAFWFGVLDGVPREQIVHWVRPLPPLGRWGPARLADQRVWNPPPGTLVVAPIEPCKGCRVLARGPNYNAWIQR